MKPHRAVASVLFALAVACTLAAQMSQTQPPARQVQYVVQELGTLGGTMGWAMGVSNSGWVQGDSMVAGDTSYHAFLCATA